MRVFAVKSADDEVVRSYGMGTLLGKRPAPERSWLAGMPNPCIKLDAGGTVWGFECWWGVEERYEEMKAGRRVEMVVAPGGDEESA